MDESVSSVYEDRLSELPESLIHVILSFLPIRDVVSTTLLSKRWENLWTTVPSLNFSEIIRENEEKYGIVGADEGNVTENGDEGNVAENGDEGNVVENGDEGNVAENGDEGNVADNGDECNVVENGYECNGAETEDEDEDNWTEDEDEDEDEDNWTEDEDEDDDNWTGDEDEFDWTEDEDEGDWTEDEDEDGDENDGTVEEEEEDDDDDDEIFRIEEEEYERDRIMTERFRKFVNRALILWKGVKILKFKIDIKSKFAHSSLVSDVHLWMLFAIKNNVEEFELITSADYWAPQCLNSCSSVRKLSLVGCTIRMDESPSWNQLKILRIHALPASGCYDGELINLILMGSPELEVFELQLRNNLCDFSISSRSLKKLKFKNSSYFHDDEDEPYLNTLSICCPNLEKLEISGLFVKCLFIDVSSLVDATLHLYNGGDNEYDYDYFGLGLTHLYELLGETLEQVFQTIQHVEKVALSDLCVQVLCASHKIYIHSALPNVKFLKLDVRHIELGGMVDLLGIFPNVKMLVIEHHTFTKPPVFNRMNYMEFEANLSKSFLSQLKLVEITVHFSDFSVFWFIEYLLKHAIMLEKLVLRSRGIASCEQQKTFSEKLLSMFKSSPTVKVILKTRE